jgi:alpha-glucoside transport system permease protein
VRPEFPPEEGAPAAPKTPWWRGLGLPAAFLLPAIFFLGIWVVYPTFATVVRSFFDDRGDSFVWFENYDRMFNDDRVQTAIKNNVLWVLVIPFGVTAVGLVFAVLTERVRWAPAFKIAVFIPLAVSLFAVGVIWRIMYQQDPERGAINAAIVGFQEIVQETGALTTARPSTDELTGSTDSGFTLEEPLGEGDVALLGLTAIRATDIPEDAVDAVEPEPLRGGITGVVWRDFKPGGGTPGQLEDEELGLPGVTVELRDEGGSQVADTTTEPDGTFRFEDVESGTYRAAIGSETFQTPYAGVSWLGASLILPSMMLAYTWVWAGFAMVVIAAGLAAIPRDLLEAARTDGANEWQVFRRITVPLLAPVLTVVFITMLIYVLKVFDIVIAIAPGSVQDDANVIALAMWRTAFGQNDHGLGAAIAVFLFLLVIPILLINVRRFRREV